MIYKYYVSLSFFLFLFLLIYTSIMADIGSSDTTSVCYKTADCTFEYCVEKSNLGANEYELMIAEQPNERSLIKQLGILDRFLIVWILLAMIIGVIIGYFVPHVQESFEVIQFGSVSVPIAIGLLVMMYPVLCKVQYERLNIILSNKQIWLQILISVIINWIIGPIIMTALAWACLPDLPGFRTGVVMVGLARCIAMVFIWNTLAGGDPDYCAVLVAINSILQIALYSPYSLLFINIIPSWFGASVDQSIHVDTWPVAQSVLIYLGIPLIAGIITRYTLRWLKGSSWYDHRFLLYFGPLALIGLLYTIIIMFANQGHHIITHIGSVARVAVPLIIYFLVMFFIPFFLLKSVFHFPYELVVTQSFTAGSNNFELAIAVAVGTYGIQSEQALAATIGPLIEVPVLLCLVYVSLYFKRKLNWGEKKKKNESSIP
ncbi:sodium bile acid symporter family-domain-containing protein [Cokeromyces recurvatus]|uniref:sodium bile acid symporter family-domain-containing protein n=1 Tax=Cokeromyces recurvatus TaxID=90255 RepID=UPI00221EBC3B|nr:sodium bile acid symporter family-domain-containing protein [Cokeromyces recurvatus]KAI7904614.1 sodium bile acid symporter family-domain-containing protein [Cokeromyces recurvatus]